MDRIAAAAFRHRALTVALLFLLGSAALLVVTVIGALILDVDLAALPTALAIGTVALVACAIVTVALRQSNDLDARGEPNPPVTYSYDGEGNLTDVRPH